MMPRPRFVPPARAPLGLVLLVVLALALPAISAAAPRAQARCFNETGFCIDEPAFQSYFDSRGGARILGFPVSRVFILEGFRVQFFQRVVLQLQGSNVARLNLLDPGILPVTHANQSVFPAPDPGLAADAPRPDDPAYAQRVVDYLRNVSPDDLNGLPVGFSSLFNSTVPAEGVSPEIRTLLNLEIWGLPTSAPAFDPGNRDFVYQRFQRGIMHFRADCRCTEGILVGDYLKTVLTGRDLPPDLAADMQSSRFFGQYAPGAAGWLARPGELTDTDLTAAFEPGTSPVVGAQPTATPAPVSQPTATPSPAEPTATPIPLASLSGIVKPPQAGIRVLFLTLPVETTTSGDGAYSINGLPLGEHFLYAMDPKGQVSDTYRLNVQSVGPATLNIDMQEFKPGSPALFIGHVVSNAGAPVNNAVVWRVGSAGRSMSDNQGLFRLTDTFPEGANQKPPDKLSLVAVSGNNWGVQSFDFSGGPNKSRLEIKLNRQGSPPPPPRVVFDFKTPNPTKVFNPNEAEFFTATWTNNGNDLIDIDVVDKDNKALPDGSFTAKSTTCLGECTLDGSGISVRLPRNVAFRIIVKGKNGGDPTKPGWDAATLTSSR